MGEVFYNSDGVIYHPDDKLINYKYQDYFPVGTGIRYYPLTTNGNDLSSYGADLYVTGVTFDKKYAEFSGGAGILRDSTITYGQVSSNFTVFCWHKMYSGSTYDLVWVMNGSDGYNIVEDTNLQLRTWYSPSGPSVYLTDPTPIAYDTWNWTCMVQYYGSYRKFWHGDIDGNLLYSGITIGTDPPETNEARSLANYNYLSLGTAGSGTNKFRGGISGLIIKSGRWLEAEVLAQAAKGPAFYNRVDE